MRAGIGDFDGARVSSRSKAISRGSVTSRSPARRPHPAVRARRGGVLFERLCPPESPSTAFRGVRTGESAAPPGTMWAMTVPRFTLNDGYALPAIGLGTWAMSDDEAATAVAEGIRTGYRLIDTAASYGNEAGVGRGIAESGVLREERSSSRASCADATRATRRRCGRSRPPAATSAWSTSTSTSSTGRCPARTRTWRPGGR
uniref:aldo/keto reductase n=1 Tax=Georgenia ruanii TaxID=348442 RepID=UPI003860133A